MTEKLELIAGRVALLDKDGEPINVGYWQDFDALKIDRGTAVVTRADITKTISLFDVHDIKIMVRR